jgi:hypothetical protein
MHNTLTGTGVVSAGDGRGGLCVRGGGGERERDFGKDT